MMALMRDGTRSSMLVFGRLLAEDVGTVEARVKAAGPGSEVYADLATFVATGKSVLAELDVLDVGADEKLDRELEAIRLAPGAEWLAIAETANDLDMRAFVAHVVHYATTGEAGYSGGPFVRCLLRSIEAGGDEERDALASGFPEYVGLWRACTNVSDGITRLRAVANL